MQWTVQHGNDTCPVCRHRMDDDAILRFLSDRPFTRSRNEQVFFNFQTWRLKSLYKETENRLSRIFTDDREAFILWAIVQQDLELYPELVESIHAMMTGASYHSLN